MHINAVVRTTENLGDHGREVSVAVVPRDGETVADFLARIFPKPNTRLDFGWHRFDPERDHVELRVVWTTDPSRTEGDPNEH